MSKKPYAAIARFYDLVFGRVVSRVHETVFRLAPPEPGDRVLDVACGTGLLLEKYHRAGARVHGIDSSREMLEVARNRVPEAGLVHGDASRMPFPRREFDIVSTTLALHEMSPEARKRVLGEIRRVTRRGGRIVIGDYSVPREKTVSGVLAGRVVETIERLAGGEHYENYLEFKKTGGVEAIPRLLGLKPEKEASIYGGCIRILVLKR